MERRQMQIALSDENEVVVVALIRFVGIARWDDVETNFALAGSNDTTEHGIDNVAQEVFDQLSHRQRNGEDPGAAAQFETLNGNWFVKQLPDDYAYLVSTTKEYPACAAIECLDELSEAFRTARRGSNRVTPTQCCLEITEKYDSMQEGSLAWRLVHEIDAEVTNPYNEKVAAMMQQIEGVRAKMNANILQHLENMERAEDMLEKADDLLLQAEVFKKQAAKLPKKTFFQKKRVWVTAAGALVGAGIGLVAGGVGTPAVVPATMAFAEGVEMVAVGAGCAVASHVAYVSAKGRWFASQKLIRLTLARIHD